MKRKIFAILVSGMLLTGCADNSESITDTGSIGKDTTVEVQEEIKTQAESSGEELTAEQDAQEESEETYVLTFEAFTIGGESLTSECFGDSKLTMINVWATYCNPCLSEMPDLGEIAASYDATDFQIIGIISDVMAESGEEDIEYAKELITQTGANYPHLLLNESLYSNLVGAVSSVPTTFFVNQEGEVLGYVVGAKSKGDWEAIINELLAEMQ